jgi:hypothetical protein
MCALCQQLFVAVRPTLPDLFGAGKLLWQIKRKAVLELIGVESQIFG